MIACFLGLKGSKFSYETFLLWRIPSILSFPLIRNRQNWPIEWRLNQAHQFMTSCKLKESPWRQKDKLIRKCCIQWCNNAFRPGICHRCPSWQETRHSGSSICSGILHISKAQAPPFLHFLHFSSLHTLEFICCDFKWVYFGQ